MIACTHRKVKEKKKKIDLNYIQVAEGIHGCLVCLKSCQNKSMSIEGKQIYHNYILKSCLKSGCGFLFNRIIIAGGNKMTTHVIFFYKINSFLRSLCNFKSFKDAFISVL